MKLLVEKGGANISIEIKPFLANVLDSMEKYSNHHNLDWKKIEILGALQYITIATLYSDSRYSSFLFLLGKLILEKISQGTKSIIELIEI